MRDARRWWWPWTFLGLLAVASASALGWWLRADSGDDVDVPSQMRLLSSDDASVRLHAVMELGRAGPRACDALPALGKAMERARVEDDEILGKAVFSAIEKIERE